MVSQEAILNRLSMIKYLYESGKRQLDQPELLAPSAILPLHDSVELFIHLIAEHLDAKTKRDTNFLEYWDFIGVKTGAVLSHKESMIRLNTARVNFKHSGILPQKRTVEELSDIVYSFFIDNCEIFFGISFDSISLVNVIQCMACRTNLENAQEQFSKGDFESASRSLALSFEYLILDYESRKITQYGQSPFWFGSILPARSAFFMNLSGDLGRFIDDTNESLRVIRQALKILSLNIDYRKYSRFRLLTPHVVQMAGGSLRVTGEPNKKMNSDEISFCKDFIIESALRLQEFDYAT